MAKKSWSEKYHSNKPFEIKRVDKKFADIPAGASMLIATPQIIANYVQQIPEGKATDIKTMRKDLAAEFHAEYTCPVTSGIFLRIAAEKAFEDLQSGKKDVTPFWRIIAPNSPLAQKLTFGYEVIAKKRKAEGI